MRSEVEKRSGWAACEQDIGERGTVDEVGIVLGKAEQCSARCNTVLGVRGTVLGGRDTVLGVSAGRLRAG